MISLTTFIYKKLLKPILFLMDPGKVHDKAIHHGVLLAKIAPIRWLFDKIYNFKDPILEQDILGVHFANPMGLAGGFDKNAQLTQILPSLGFGFIEVGSITAKPYRGNPKPHVKRYPKTQSLWVNYGLKNIGAKKNRENLDGLKFKIPVCFNIAKTNCKETADRDVAAQDYCESVKSFQDIAVMFTINISCPNAFGGQPFHDSEDLDVLLKELEKLKITQPVFLKISPELSDTQIDTILKVCDGYKVDGIIMTNLRKKKVDEDFAEGEKGLAPEYGGMSGKYVEPLADKTLKYVAGKVKRGECKKYVLVGLGGVFTAQDAYKKIRLGASLVQLVTGMIFEGPSVIAEIDRGLVKLLKKDGFKNISEAVGVDVV